MGWVGSIVIFLFCIIPCVMGFLIFCDFSRYVLKAFDSQGWNMTDAEG